MSFSLWIISIDPDSTYAKLLGLPGLFFEDVKKWGKYNQVAL